MFDDVNNKKTNAEEEQSTSSSPNKPSSDAAPAGQAEDIFAETDKGVAAQPEKPAVFQPKAKEVAPGNANGEKIKASSGMEKKYIIIALIVLAVIIIVYGGYLAYGRFFMALPSEELTGETGEQPAGDSPATQAEPKQEPTSVLPPDSDQDGLSDQEEKELGTNPNSVDSDDDGLFDREEVKVYKTDPMDADTDGDGYLDGDEVQRGYNPKGPGKLFEIE